MKHTFIDHYAYGNSPVHRLKPAVKLLFTLVFILALLIFSPSHTLSGGQLVFYGAAFLFLCLIVILSDLPPGAILKKVLVIFPFIFVLVLFNLLAGKDPAQAGFFLFRSVLSLLALVLLVATTKFHDLLAVLASWRVPRVICLTLSFMYRYFFLLRDEGEKMTLAFRSRYQGNRAWDKIKLLSLITGMLFIRSYERAERVYAAMVMRGYEEMEG